MKKHLIVGIILAGLLVGAAQAQWLDTTLYLGLGGGPSALVCDSVDNRIYCANYYGCDVSVIDGASDEVVAVVPVGEPAI